MALTSEWKLQQESISPWQRLLHPTSIPLYPFSFISFLWSIENLSGDSAQVNLVRPKFKKIGSDNCQYKCMTYNFSKIHSTLEILVQYSKYLPKIISQLVLRRESRSDKCMTVKYLLCFHLLIRLVNFFALNLWFCH